MAYAPNPTPSLERPSMYAYSSANAGAKKTKECDSSDHGHRGTVSPAVRDVARYVVHRRLRRLLQVGKSGLGASAGLYERRTHIATMARLCSSRWPRSDDSRGR